MFFFQPGKMIKASVAGTQHGARAADESWRNWTSPRSLLFPSTKT